MRYTEARLTRLATEMLRDIDMDTVDFGPNYDGSQREPLVLPSRFPEPAGQRFPRDRGRHGDQISRRTTHRGCRRSPPTSTNREIDLEGLMKRHQGPDFPGGGV